MFGSEKGFLNGGMEELHAATAFDRAAGGTLLLDEVGELSAPHQIKLLDILDSLQSMGVWHPRGRRGWMSGLSPLRAWTFSRRRPTGSFRKDLLNRLGTLLIHVPSIRERKEDIPFLIRHFLASACREQGRKVQLSGKVFKKLCEHDWPGNIAEIKNTVIRLVIMADGAEIEAEDLASDIRPEATGRSRCNRAGGNSRLVPAWIKSSARKSRRPWSATGGSEERPQTTWASHSGR